MVGLKGSNQAAPACWPYGSSATVGACIQTPYTSALLTGNFIVVSFAVFLLLFVFFFCPSFTILSSLTYWLFLFILLLDGPVTQSPGKSIDPPGAEAAAQAEAPEGSSHLFWHWGDMEGSPYFTFCFDKLPYFVVLLFGDFFCDFPFDLPLGNTP